MLEPLTFWYTENRKPSIKTSQRLFHVKGEDEISLELQVMLSTEK